MKINENLLAAASRGRYVCWLHSICLGRKKQWQYYKNLFWYCNGLKKILCTDVDNDIEDGTINERNEVNACEKRCAVKTRIQPTRRLGIEKHETTLKTQ